MIENFNLLLLSGGFYHCTVNWDKTADGLDKCFKFYFPVGGQACVRIDGTDLIIRAGNAYFINGFLIEKQYCQKDMDVYWVHFVPESLHLHHLLSESEPIHSWKFEEIDFSKKVFTKLDLLFQNPFRPKNDLSLARPQGLDCQVRSLFLWLIGDLIRREHPARLSRKDDLILRLRPSINYMNENLLKAPSLSEIAQQSHLAPNYFHRLFRQTFKMTPFAYITRRRLNMSRNLLSTTALEVKEVAALAGYEDEFYFSRVFKRYFHISPSHFRKDIQFQTKNQ